MGSGKDDGDYQEMVIPKNSFTAFRLKYCDALELYNTTAVVFLGNIPNTWILDKKSVILAKLYRLDNMKVTGVTNPEHRTLDHFENSAFDEMHHGEKLRKNSTDSHHAARQMIFASLLKKSLLHSSLDDHNRGDEDILHKTVETLEHEIDLCAGQTLHKLSTFIPIISKGQCFFPSTVGPKNEKLTASNTGEHNSTGDTQTINTDPRLIEDGNSLADTHNQKYVGKNQHLELWRIFDDYESADSDVSDSDSINIQNNTDHSAKAYNGPLQFSNSSGDKIGCKDSKKETFMNSMEAFLAKPIEERQAILKTEINDAMAMLQNKRSKETADLEQLSSDSDDSFVTASEVLPPTNTEDITIPPTRSQHKHRATVTFSDIKSTPMVNSMSAYTLESRRLLLEKETPKPFGKDELPPVEEAETAYTGIDEDVAGTYDLLKTDTIGVKLGLSQELQKLERKRKLKKLLQNFQSGEVIKMEKMLAMVSTVDGTTFQNSGTPSRILERWKEYVVVVRATDDVDYPAVIQFFKGNMVFKLDSSSNLKDHDYEEDLEKQILEDEEEYEESTVTHVVERDTNDIENNYSCANTNSVDRQSRDNYSKGDDDGDETCSSGTEHESSTLRSNKESNSSTLTRSLFRLGDMKRQNQEKSRRPKLKRKEKKNKKLKEDKKIRKKHFDGSNISDCKKIKKIRQSCSFTLALSKHDIQIGFSNLLDKSIRISRVKKNSITVYTLLAHSSTSAIIWISFLKQLIDPRAVSTHRKRTLLINLPVLDISFTILQFRGLCKKLIANEFLASKYITVKFRNDGYEFPKSETFDRVLNMVASQIVQLESANKLPKTAAVKDFVSKVKNNRSFLALSFRKYDRLEWIVGENEPIVQILWNIFGSSYELELREFQHEAHILANGSMVEPLPVEGFVAKLSNRNGNLKTSLGKHYFKLLYAFSVENLLFFQDFYNAVPIFPSSKVSARNFISPAGDVLDLRQLEESAKFAPTSYHATPYPRTEHHIQWLTPRTTEEEYYTKDADALYEAERRACMISNAEFVVDLCKITDIRLVSKDDVSHIIKIIGSNTWGHHYRDRFKKKLGKFEFRNKDESAEYDEYFENCLDLVISDNTIVRLQVSTKTIRNEWARNLSNLSKYWTLKKRENLARHVSLNEKNKTMMSTTNDNYKSLIGNEDESICSKWQLSKAQTDCQLYSISSYALDKPVLMKGYIYCKKFKSKQFHLFYAVLSPGFLILYEIFNRSAISGVARPSAYYKRYAAISLASCYVFSNMGKSGDNLKSKVFFNSKLNSVGLPRVYGDGWKSSESKNERVFTLWFGSKRIMMKNVSVKKGMDLNEKRNIFSEHIKNLQSSSETEYNSTDDENIKEYSGDDAVRNKKHNFASRFRRERKSQKLKHGYESDGSGYADKSDYASSDSNDISSDDTTSSLSDENEPESSLSDSQTFDSKNFFKLTNAEAGEEPEAGEFIKTVTRLGITGKALMFLARSRVDRDLWVTRLMTEMERFSDDRNSDIRLV